MIRYDMVRSDRCGTTVDELKPSDDGDWVRYEDVQAEIVCQSDRLLKAQYLLHCTRVREDTLKAERDEAQRERDDWARRRWDMERERDALRALLGRCLAFMPIMTPEGQTRPVVEALVTDIFRACHVTETP